MYKWQRCDPLAVMSREISDLRRAVDHGKTDRSKPQ